VITTLPAASTQKMKCLCVSGPHSKRISDLYHFSNVRCIRLVSIFRVERRPAATGIPTDCRTHCAKSLPGERKTSVHGMRQYVVPACGAKRACTSASSTSGVSGCPSPSSGLVDDAAFVADDTRSDAANGAELHVGLISAIIGRSVEDVVHQDGSPINQCIEYLG
jgi:hypothetical protein